IDPTETGAEPCPLVGRFLQNFSAKEEVASIPVLAASAPDHPTRRVDRTVSLWSRSLLLLNRSFPDGCRRRDRHQLQNSFWLLRMSVNLLYLLRHATWLPSAFRA